MSQALKQLWKHSSTLIILSKNPTSTKINNFNYKVSSMPFIENGQQNKLFDSLFIDSYWFLSHSRYWFWNVLQTDRIREQLYFQAVRLKTPTTPKIGWTSIGNSVLMNQNSNQLQRQHRIGRSFSNVMIIMCLIGELITNVTHIRLKWLSDVIQMNNLS